jgi:hypothetical protein
VLGGLLLILVALIVWFFLNRDEGAPTITSSSDTSSSSPTKTKTTTTTSEASETTQPQTGGEATDGDFTFSVGKVDRVATVASADNPVLTKTATGEFVVVTVEIENTGTFPLNFVGAQQTLNADGQTFTPDTEATFYIGGASVIIDPEGKVEVPVAFDVPVGTTPTSIQLHGAQGGSGVELPL